MLARYKAVFRLPLLVLLVFAANYVSAQPLPSDVVRQLVQEAVEVNCGLDVISIDTFAIEALN